jgi:hypothetical protein
MHEKARADRNISNFGKELRMTSGTVDTTWWLQKHVKAKSKVFIEDNDNKGEEDAEGDYEPQPGAEPEDKSESESEPNGEVQVIQPTKGKGQWKSLHIKKRNCLWRCIDKMANLADLEERRAGKHWRLWWWRVCRIQVFHLSPKRIQLQVLM